MPAATALTVRDLNWVLKGTQAGRIDHYGEADYTSKSNTANWLKLQIMMMGDKIITNREIVLAQKTTQPPKHLNSSKTSQGNDKKGIDQDTFLI